MSTVRKSVVLSVFQKYLETFISFITVIVLSRILTPEEIGIFAVAAVLLGIAHMLRDFGVGQYVIQEKELTEERIRTAYGITISFAWPLALAIYLLSTPIAGFYEEEGVEKILQLMAVNFLLIPFSSITIAFLNREMKFKKLLHIKTASALANSATAIILAYLGFSYMSMAWASVIGIVVTILVAALYRPSSLPWLPSFSEYKRVLSFGSFSSGASVLMMVGTSSPSLILGKLIGMEAVGFYNRASSTVQIFNHTVTSAIGPVVMPHLSAKNRHGERLDEPYNRAISYMTCIGWPFFAVLALMADPVINLLYGDQWGESVPVAQILCVAALFKISIAYSKQALVASGNIKRDFMTQLIVQPMIVLVILFFAQFGLEAVATGLVFVSLVNVLVVQWHLRQAINISMKNYWRAIRLSMLVAMIALIPAVIVKTIFNGEEINSLVLLLTAVRVAELLELNPFEVIGSAHAERAKSVS